MQKSALKRFSQLAVASTALVFGATGVAAAHGAPNPATQVRPGNYQSHVVPRHYQWHQHDDRGTNGHYQTGEIVPGRFRSQEHYVKNPSAHNLSRPAQGYRWVHTSDHGDYLLINEKTGVIVGVIAA